MIKGLNEVKKASKLLIKKQKLENKINNLAKKYYATVNIKTSDNEYFFALINDYLSKNKK